MELYKYTKKVDFDRLMKTGSIRVGTLFGYRRYEKGGMVGDNLDGIIRVSGHFDPLSKKDIQEIPMLRELLAVSGGRPEDLIGEETYLATYLSSKDIFVFSMSDQYSEEMLRKWYAKEEYDCCYKISSLGDFFRKLTIGLQDIHQVEFIGWDKIVYHKNTSQVDFNDPEYRYPIYQIKDKKDFEDQEECRAIWMPHSGEPFNIDHQDLLIEGLGNHVELVACL